MVNLSARKKELKVLFSLFLALTLLVGPLLNTSVYYAADEQDPNAPQNLRVEPDSITATSATIKWDLNPDLNDIDVWLADGDVYFDWGNSGSKELTSLQPETTYRLYITWYERPATLTHKSNIIEFTTPAGEIPEPTLPEAGATNLEVVEVTHNTVSLRWVNAEGIDDYWIWDTNNVYKGWGNSQFKVLGGLEPETTYSLFLGPDGIQIPQLTENLRSNIVTFTTLEDLSEYEEHPLTPPQNVRVLNLTETSVTLGWTGSPGADGYDYWVNGVWTGGVWDGSNQFTYTLPAEQQVDGTVIKFLVAAQKTVDGLTSSSEKANEVTLVWGELEPPRDLQVVTANRSTVALGWAPTQGATSYEIYQDDVLIKTTSTNRLVVDGLNEGQTYSFHVIAKNALWESDASQAISAVPGAQYTNVTYYTSWSRYETARNYKPEDIDISQITHINYAFSDLCWKKAGTTGVNCENENLPLQNEYVHDGEIVIGDEETDPINYEAFSEIKANHPHLKMLVSVGGWSWSKNFSNMAADEITRRAFANSAVAFLREYDLDGLDIDWEYPVEGGESYNIHRPEDNLNFTLTMKTVREALDAAGSVDGKYYLLTIASGQGDNFVRNADLVNAVNYLDFINIMTYDYSGSWELFASHNSPLYYDKNNRKETAQRNNVRGGAVGHLNGGVPTHQLVLGIPYYGKGWSGCPDVGQYDTCTSIPAGTWEAGIFDYTDIEENFLEADGFTYYWNEAAKVPYLFNEDTGTFITYNDPTTMMYTSSLVRSLDLAGVMSWEISGDRNRSLTTQLIKDLPINGVVNTNTLAAPQNLRHTSISGSKVNLAWGTVADATGYEVYQGNQYVGYTTDTKYSITQLTPASNYSFYVLAIKKEDDAIVNVSPSSNFLEIKTASPIYTSTPTPTEPSKDKDELSSDITKSGDSWTVDILKNSAVDEIKAIDQPSFKVTVSDNAKEISINVPQEVTAAIAAKGKDAQLSVIWGGVTYVIPIHALPLDADIRISIAPPSADVTTDIAQLAEDDNLRLLIQPLDFIILKRAANDMYDEVTDFGSFVFSRHYTLTDKDIDRDHITGVVYDPNSNQFRPVPTLFTKNVNGTINVQLNRNGNSIYSIVQSDISYSDASPAWMKDYVARAAAKLLLPGETEETFGVSSSITRAEFISMIVKGLGLMPDTGVAPFGDVAADSAYAGDIAAAKRLGLIQGSSATSFNPDSSISRQDIAVIISNVLKYLGESTDVDTTILQSFRDADIISDYAKSSVALVVKHGIMIGKTGSKFAPKEDLTRAEAAVIVIRILDSYGLD